MVIVLIEAFWHLRSMKVIQTISRKQILLQVVVNSLFAFSQLFQFFLFPYKVLFDSYGALGVILNALGLFVLQLTLMQIADL